MGVSSGFGRPPAGSSAGRTGRGAGRPGDADRRRPDRTTAVLGGRGLRLAAAAGGGAARHRWPAAAGSGRRRLGGGRVWDGRERRRPSLLRLTRCSGFFFGAMCASAGLRMRLWIAATASCRKIKQRTQPSKFFVHHYLPLESLEPIAGKHFSFKMESSGGAGGIRFSCQMSYF